MSELGLDVITGPFKGLRCRLLGHRWIAWATEPERYQVCRRCSELRKRR